MKVVIFTFNDPLKGRHGGATRVLKLAEYLSTSVAVSVIIPAWEQPTPNKTSIGKVTFKYVKISPFWRLIEGVFFHIGKSLKISPWILPTILSYIYVDPPVTSFLENELKDADIIQSEFSWSLGNAIKSAHALSIPQVHTAHDLATYWFLNEKKFLSHITIMLLFSTERRQLSKAGTIIFPSSLDYYIAKNVLHLNNDMFVIPHGVDSSLLKIIRAKKPNIVLFIGSSHGPNIEAAIIVIKQFAPKLPECTFVFVGSVCNAIDVTSLPTNVQLKGVVSDEELLQVYSYAAVGIIPLLSGSGMKVKTMELLAAGIPIISTSIGIEGLAVIHGKDVIIENDLNHFNDWIHKLVCDQSLNDLLSKNGRDFARCLTWDATLKLYSEIYADL